MTVSTLAATAKRWSALGVPVEWLELGWVRLDDEFELDDGTWEEHYAINVARLKPEHFID